MTDYRKKPIVTLKDGQFAIGCSRAAKNYYSESVQPTKEAAERLALVWTIQSCYDTMTDCAGKLGVHWGDVIA